MDTKHTITGKLKKYIRRLKKDIPIDKAFLVGSWACGKAKRDSDVDIVLLSKAFEKMDFDQRLTFVYKSTIGMDLDMHIHPVTKEEFESASTLTSLGMMRNDKKISLI